MRGSKGGEKTSRGPEHSTAENCTQAKLTVPCAVDNSAGQGGKQASSSLPLACPHVSAHSGWQSDCTSDHPGQCHALRVAVGPHSRKPPPKWRAVEEIFLPHLQHWPALTFFFPLTTQKTENLWVLILKSRLNTPYLRTLPTHGRSHFPHYHSQIWLWFGVMNH